MIWNSMILMIINFYDDVAFCHSPHCNEFEWVNPMVPWSTEVRIICFFLQIYYIKLTRESSFNPYAGFEARSDNERSLVTKYIFNNFPLKSNSFSSRLQFSTKIDFLKKVCCHVTNLTNKRISTITSCSSLFSFQPFEFRVIFLT